MLEIITGLLRSIAPGIPYLAMSGRQGSQRKLQEERLQNSKDLQETQQQFQMVQANEQRFFQAEQGELNRKHQAKLEKARQLEQAKNRDHQLILQELQRNFQADQNAENRAAQRANLIKQLEFQRDTQLKIKALDAETSFKIRAFDRETALNNIHEQKRLQNLPIVDRPEQYLQGNTQNPDVHIFFAPPTVRHDNRKVTGDLKISEDALARQIRNFLDSYKAAERTNRFHGGGWQTRAIHSETAIEAIFRELKSEPTLIIETFAEAQDYHIRFGFWAPNFPKYQYKEVFSFNWLQVLGDLAKATTLEYEKRQLSQADFIDIYGKPVYDAYQNNRDLIAKEAKARKFNLPEDEIQHHILSKYKPFTKNTKQLIEYISLYHNIGAGILLDQYYLLHAPADQRKKPLLPQLLPQLLKGISNEAALTELKREVVRLYAQLYDCLAEDRYQTFELPNHYLYLAELAFRLKSPEQAQLALQKSTYYFLVDRNIPQLPSNPEAALLFLTDPICCPYLLRADFTYLKNLRIMTDVLTQLNTALKLSPQRIIAPEQVEAYLKQEEQRRQAEERLRKEEQERKRKEEEQRRRQEEARRQSRLEAEQRKRQEEERLRKQRAEQARKEAEQRKRQEEAEQKRHQEEAERLRNEPRDWSEKGDDYYGGRNGVDKNYYKAFNYYKKAAKRDHAYAQYSLGWMYEHGQGTDSNTEKASKWYKKACENGNESGCENYKRLKEMDLVIDGETYKTVKIGSQIWMAENLNLEVADSCFYDNNPENGKKYGRLYSWEAAKAAADLVPGWHLPTDEEWKTLEMALGMSEKHANKLTHLWSWSRGTDQGNKLRSGGSSGFNALLGGYHTGEGYLNGLGAMGYFWSASPRGSSHAWNRHVFGKGGYVHRNYSYRTAEFSVRLVKD